jgi:alpha-glucosidase
MTIMPMLTAAVLLVPTLAIGAEYQVASPDGTIVVTVDDTQGLAYRVAVDGKPLLVSSRLGLVFKGGLEFGSTSHITAESRAKNNGTWINPFGKQRIVPDRWHELRLTVAEPNDRSFAVVVRAYDDGVALRYDLPEASKLGTFILTDERTEFAFAADHRSWSGDPGGCAENQYPERPLSKIPNGSVLPTLVETPVAFAAITEADLLDWAGMFLRAVPDHSAVKVDLAKRRDGHGLVQATVPIVSPWRVVMIGRKPGDLITSSLVETLATPNRIGDTAWIKPGITAWDPWWSKSVNSRGDTASDKPFINLAATMGWPYMLVDWGWTKNGDVTQWNPKVNVPELLAYAKERHVQLLLWMHSDELNKTGVERGFSTVASWGVPGVKVDFMNSDSQEMVQWYVSTLATAAKHHLMVDFHGAYKPTGLARTFPNYVTQEGVLGNEYNKLNSSCSVRHTMTLPFTRGLLGPMDFTPGGFQNRTPAEWVKDAGSKTGGNCQVLGTRAHQLALTMIYTSPLLCLCDSPTSYLGADLKSPEPGLEFYRGLPTVWDETLVLDAKVAEHLVMARRSGNRWYIGAMSGDAGLTIQVPLTFLKSGSWTIRSWSDTPESAAKPMLVNESTATHTTTETLSLPLSAGGGGFVAVCTPKP